MHEVSDGERRRVQIVSGLMAPWDVLLLDEVSFQSRIFAKLLLTGAIRLGHGRSRRSRALPAPLVPC